MRALTFLVCAPAVLCAVGCLADPSPSGEMGKKELAVTYCASGDTTEGIDVSKWQGEIDWDAVAGDGIRFAIIRVTHGTEVIDEWFDTNWRRAREVGITRGAYQYFEGGQDPLEQADLFVDLVGALEPGDLPPVIDVESPDGNPPSAEYQANVRAWLDRVEEGLGLPPIIYTGKYYWDDHLDGTAEFEDHPLWQAWWSADCPNTPNGWSQWTFWQYSSTGRVAGISGDVDLDRFDGPMEDLLGLGAGGECGDGACNGGESPASCEADCPPCQWIEPEGGILDESGPCFRGGGDPQYLRSVGEGWESSLIWTHTTDFDHASNFGEWQLSFREAGRYRVEAYTQAPWAQSRQAGYQITHAGAAETITVDQSAVDGWSAIGDLEFAAGHGQLVRLDDNTGEPNDGNVQLVFDAVRFTRLDAPGDGDADVDVDVDVDADADIDGDGDSDPMPDRDGGPGAPMPGGDAGCGCGVADPHGFAGHSAAVAAVLVLVAFRRRRS